MGVWHYVGMTLMDYGMVQLWPFVITVTNLQVLRRRRGGGGVSWPPASLSAFQAGHCPMELTKQKSRWSYRKRNVHQRPHPSTLWQRKYIHHANTSDFFQTHWLAVETWYGQTIFGIQMKYPSFLWRVLRTVMPSIIYGGFCNDRGGVGRKLDYSHT